MLDLFNTPGLRHVGSVTNERVNGGNPVPLFEPVSPAGNLNINTLEGWNAAAEKANRRAFSQAFGRKPSCADELKAWQDSHFSKDFVWSGKQLYQEDQQYEVHRHCN